MRNLAVCPHKHRQLRIIPHNETILPVFTSLKRTCVRTTCKHFHTHLRALLKRWQAFHHSCGRLFLTIYFHKETSLIHWFWDTHSHTESSGQSPSPKENTANETQLQPFVLCPVSSLTVLSHLKGPEERISPHMDCYTAFLSIFLHDTIHACVIILYMMTVAWMICNCDLFWSIHPVNVTVFQDFTLPQLIWFIIRMIELLLLSATAKTSGESDSARHTHSSGVFIWFLILCWYL